MSTSSPATPSDAAVSVAKVDVAVLSMSSNVQAAQPNKSKQSPLVMQIILRRDLETVHDWPIGPLLAQSAHAATAVLHLHAQDPNRHRLPDEGALRSLAERLKQEQVGYHMWIEQPEDIPTAIALVPNRRPKALKKLLDQAGCTLWK
ncbi:hypothetical protein BCR39DRAFT_560593 [Naematelia encephala]|uniref:peptidyl-tRNA hydrolase n=1 Tax=Naematelia encephala TaxID=71784 RepID=A0A1Y2AVS6_9TREE|nr:hypothetical protein BCR39DRAFT_560593 [Naematelia encephala]